MRPAEPAESEMSGAEGAENVRIWPALPAKS